MVKKIRGKIGMGKKRMKRGVEKGGNRGESERRGVIKERGKRKREKEEK